METPPPSMPDLTSLAIPYNYQIIPPRNEMEPWSRDLQQAIQEARGYWETTHRAANINMSIPDSSVRLGPLLSLLNTFAQNERMYGLYGEDINTQLNAILLYLTTKIDECSENDYPKPRNYDYDGYFEKFSEKNPENIKYWCKTVVREYGEQLKNAYITGDLIGGYANYDTRMNEYISRLIPERINEIVHKHTLLSFLNQYFETDIIQAGYVYEAVKIIHNDYINHTHEADEARRRPNFFSDIEIYGHHLVGGGGGGKRRKKKSNKKKRKITKKTKKKNNRKKTKKRKK